MRRTFCGSSEEAWAVGCRASTGISELGVKGKGYKVKGIRLKANGKRFEAKGKRLKVWGSQVQGGTSFNSERGTVNLEPLGVQSSNKYAYQRQFCSANILIGWRLQQPFIELIVFRFPNGNLTEIRVTWVEKEVHFAWDERTWNG